jgi:hypothetical protein
VQDEWNAFITRVEPAKPASQGLLSGRTLGVKDLFGSVSPNALPPGVHLIVPFTRVHKMSIRTMELKETAEVLINPVNEAVHDEVCFHLERRSEQPHVVELLAGDGVDPVAAADAG